MQLDLSVRVIRLRLRRLLAEGKLIEGRDCLRDGYVDETHFIWRVDPAAFVRATGSQPVIRSATHSVTQFRSTDNQSDNRVPKAGALPSDEVGQTMPNVDKPSSALEREMIDLLKGQLSAKDGQIADLSEQNKKLNDVNLKLVAQTVQQSDRIQTLLRLTEGKMELADAVTTADNEMATADSNQGDLVADTDNDFGNQPPSSSRNWGRDLAA